MVNVFHTTRESNFRADKYKLIWRHNGCQGRSITHGSSVGLLTKSVPDHFHDTSAGWWLLPRSLLVRCDDIDNCETGRPNEYWAMPSLTSSSSLASISRRVYTDDNYNNSNNIWILERRHYNSSSSSYDKHSTAQRSWMNWLRLWICR